MQNDNDNHVEWGRSAQKLAASTWVSFLTASIMTLVFFAFFDPLLLAEQFDYEHFRSREVGYSVGFFFFWAGCFTSSWLSLRLTRHKRNGPKRMSKAGGAGD